MIDDSNSTTQDQPSQAISLLTPLDESGQSLIDLPNLATVMEDHTLGEIGDRCVKEYEIDVLSRGDWRKKVDTSLDMARQIAKEKTWPWPNASNVIYPLITSAALQFAARAYPSLVPGRELVKAKVQGRDPEGGKSARGSRVAHHLSYQLVEEMDEWEPDTDKLLHVVPIVGFMVRKTWFSPAEGRLRSRLLFPNEVVWNYGSKFDEAPRVTHEFERYPHEITENVRAGIWLDVELGLPDDAGDDFDAPHAFLEQHRRWDLDEDGYAEPYIVTVHEKTRKVVRVVAAFGKDDIDFNQENGEIARIARASFFTKYGFLPSLDESDHDTGFYLLLGSLNQTVNTVLNQLLDAGTRQNAGGGFIGRGLRMRGGVITLTPGQYKPLDATGAAIRDNLVDLQHPGPSPVLFQLLGLLIDAGREIASVTDVLTGDSPGANVPATTTLALIEQGMKVYSSILKRLHRAFKNELKIMFRLNGQYLNPETYFTLLDTEEAVQQQDYAEGDLDVVPVSDPTMVSKAQEMAKAEAMLQFVGDPDIDALAVKRRFFEALGIDNVDELLKTDPQPDPRALQVIGKIEDDHAVADSQRVLNLARAIEALAKAEAAEAGPQLEMLKIAMQELMSGNTDAGRVPGMGGAPGDAQGPAGAIGIAPTADGSMGAG